MSVQNIKERQEQFNMVCVNLDDVNLSKTDLSKAIDVPKKYLTSA